MTDVEIKNCTKDVRNLIAPVAKGANLMLTLRPGETKEIPKEALDRFKQNSMIRKMFIDRLLVEVKPPPAKPKPRPKRKRAPKPVDDLGL